jgi:putative methionine-R-sulfoxide reductase with GAF domain
VKEPNSFGDPEGLKDLHGTELADALAAQREESHLNQELEQACLATGATGAAIALVRGEEIVCHATAGPHEPALDACVDPRNGLSGSCIQTRRLQQCVDTQTDPRVDPETCRHLGVRSIVVLPLIDGDELFGIVEFLSSRPNAFGQHDLDTLQALTGRIVESRRQNWEAQPLRPCHVKSLDFSCTSWEKSFPRTRATPQNRNLGCHVGSAHPEETTCGHPFSARS